MSLENIRQKYIAEMAKEKKVKNYADTYLYHAGKYEKKIIEYMMTADIVDRSTESYLDIQADVKRRQVTSSLVSVLNSKNTKLCIGVEPLPRAFKVFVANDIKGDGKQKVFIDVTEIIKLNNGRYVCTNNDIDIFVSYLLSAMNALIFYTDPQKLVGNNSLTSNGCKCFSSMVYYILDYLRIFGSSEGNKEKCDYLSSIYYQCGLLNKDSSSSSTVNIAKKISGLSDRQVELLDIHLDGIKDPYKNIKTFIETIAKIFKVDKLTLDVFVDKWMWLYGYGTQFGTETYPAFANMLIHAYVGAYLNNQKTIEKVTGKPMVDFVNDIMRIGSDLV